MSESSSRPHPPEFQINPGMPLSSSLATNENESLMTMQRVERERRTRSGSSHRPLAPLHARQVPPTGSLKPSTNV
uniref:Uncharacterized protein n=1 Tax=Oryza glumipatula TaxID=40148 RepID=A0A0D9Z5B9_9ORYZ